MKQHFNKSTWLKIGVILLIGAALRLPGVFWGEIDRPATAIVLEPDEYQHSDIAANYLNQWNSAIGYPMKYRAWNAQAFGYQLAWVAYIGYQFNWLKITDKKLILLGRVLSTIYALLLIFLIFRFTYYLTDREDVAHLAALFFALFDLNVTYSHYAVPASSYIFWTHAAIFSIILFYLKLREQTSPIKWRTLLQTWPIWLAMNLAIGLSLGIKFDFIPCLIGGLALGLLWFNKKLSFKIFLVLGLLLPLTSFFFFLLAHGFRMELADLTYSFDIATGLNADVVQNDNHLLHNPLVYGLGMLAGVGIPAFVLAIYGSVKAITKPDASDKSSSNRLRIALLLWLVFLALEITTRWMLDTTFIRRANFILPFIAVFGAFGFYQFLHNRKTTYRNLFFAVVTIYTLGVTLTSQYNFWNDTRYRAIPFLQEVSQGKEVDFPGYAWVPGMPGSLRHNPSDPDILIIHESYYGRFWKSFTTPFKIPECCTEVYHCPSEELCHFYQDLLSGNSDYQLLKIYPTLEVFPERLLFKHLFGSYETFLGDLRIYEKTSNE